MPVDIQAVPYTAQRLTLSSSKPLDAVLTALRDELNADRAGSNLLLKIKDIKSAEELHAFVSTMTEGKRDFVYFGEVEHSQWMDTFYSQRYKRTIIFTLGNPLVAKEMLKHDMSAGLHIPPKIMVQDGESGGASISYDLPSSVIPGGRDQSSELRAATEELDRKLQRMLESVLREA
ncbi:hypothetical protein BC835DRAFT_1415633 [Cytidiella melzeri]|nr:hypothetical protein BC835DRAFT_1415633 [Cytidiella melzeri]